MPRTGRGAFGRTAEPSGKPITVTVTLPSGESFSGKLERMDDFTVSLMDSNGDYHSFIRNGDSPRVEIHDPIQAHKDLLLEVYGRRHPQSDSLFGDPQMKVRPFLLLTALASLPLALLWATSRSRAVTQAAHRCLAYL